MPPKKAYESNESDSDGDNDGKKSSQGKKQKLDKETDDYKSRRERNNIAVRKSREASRKKAKDTMERVKQLRNENDALEQKVTILNKELGVLRDLFLTHASATGNSEIEADATKTLRAEETLEDNNTGDNRRQLKSDSFASDHRHSSNGK